jgi:hypothetical protein
MLIQQSEVRFSEDVPHHLVHNLLESFQAIYFTGVMQSFFERLFPVHFVFKK